MINVQSRHLLQCLHSYGNANPNQSYKLYMKAEAYVAYDTSCITSAVDFLMLQEFSS